jgi:hypothetical protein
MTPLTKVLPTNPEEVLAAVKKPRRAIVRCFRSSGVHENPGNRRPVWRFSPQ